MLVCINGQFIPHEDARVAITDGSVLFGDTLFETIKAKENTILLQRQHLDRLYQSAKLIGLSCPRQRIEKALGYLAASLSTPWSRIRLTLSRGPFNSLQFPDDEKAWFLITAAPYTPPIKPAEETGISCCLAPNRRVNPLSHLPQLKRGNYADCLYARNYAFQCNTDEALFVDSRGYLLEGATSNLFALIDKRLVTPPAGRLVLKGIMRQQVLAAATEIGILTHERPLHVNEVYNADEAFITNAMIDIRPILNIGEHRISPGNCWRALLKTLSLRIGS